MKSTNRRKIELRKQLLGYGTDSRFPTGLVVVSLVFPIIAWLLELIINDYELTIYGIVEMHRNSPVVLIADIIPIIAGVVGYKLEMWLENLETHYQQSIDEKKSIIQKNAFFAKQIGEGKLDINEDAIDEQDLLGNSLIRMRDNLLRTSERESERNWIAAGKDKVATILRLHNDLDELAYDTLVNLIDYIKVIQGAFYIFDEEEGIIENRATYAYNRRKYVNQKFKIGEGLVGQAAFEMDIIYRKEIPEDYLSITSGLLKEQKPNTILVVPLITDEKLQGVLEFASLDTEITSLTINFLRELGDVIARTLFNLKVNKRTEKLLKDSQEMTEELKENEEELRQNAEEMRATHEELERSNEKLEVQIVEVENAQKRLHSLLENASEVISIYDQKLNLKYISPSVTNIYGFTPDEMMEGKDMDRLTANGAKEIQKMFAKLLESPSETIVIQYTYMNKVGKKIYI
ncbi:MAG: GAF domain-containing protein, partial [Salinivirgaceae bacterium]